MRSNGFGSWEQTVFIDLPEESVDAVLEEFGDRMERVPSTAEGRARVKWTNWTTTTGDDETVVFMLFGGLEAICPRQWRIDWDASDY